MGAYENILGTLIIGVFFNTFLYGVVSVQYLSYYSRKFDDSLTTKAGVLLLFLNDSFQTGAMIYLAWIYCITGIGAPSLLDHVVWPYAYVPIGTALAAVITHMAMAYRIYCMSNVCLYSVLIVASLASLGTGIAFGVGVWTLPFITMHGSLKTLVAWWLGFQAALDVVIACQLIYFLHRQRTGSESSANSVINRLIRGTIQAGFLPLIFAVAGLITFIVRPNTNLFIMFIIPIGRTYTMSFMDGMNVRDKLKERLLGSSDSNIFASAEVAWPNPTSLPKVLTAVGPKYRSLDHPEVLSGIPGTVSFSNSGNRTTSGVKKSLSNPIIVHAMHGDYRAPWEDPQ